jgi:hypothetical protein
MLNQRKAEKAKLEEFLAMPKMTVEALVTNPIQTGYLLKFCKQEFSEENLEFMMTVQKFSDNLSTRDKNGWPAHNSMEDHDAVTKVLEDPELVYDIDLEKYYADNQKSTPWPSRIVIRDWVEKDVVRIWNKYISNDSPNQICMPSKVLVNTIKRLKLLHIYGPRVFDETLIDPLKTLGRDILPRFVNSPVYQEMRQRLTSLLDLPEASALESSSPLTSKITPARCAFLNISMAMEDRLVYDELLAYMQSLYAAENILACRMIRMYRAMWQSDIAPGVGVSAKPGSTPATSDSSTVFKRTKTPAEMQAINDFAWTVYKYHIVAGSAYEVCISIRQAKDIMWKLAIPTMDMFDKAELSALVTVREHFNMYKRSKWFPVLIDKAQQKCDQEEAERIKAAGCFGSSKDPGMNNSIHGGASSHGR